MTGIRKESNMGNEDYLGWYDRMSCTILTRGITLSKEEMRVAGIIQVINYEAVLEDESKVGSPGHDGMSDDDRMAYLIRRGRAMGADCAVWAECAIKGVKNPKTGETGYINAYSGIVFKTSVHLNLFCLKNRATYDVTSLPICN